MAKSTPETNPFVQKESGFRINAIWKMEELVASGDTREHEGPNDKSSSQWHAYRYETDDKVTLYTRDLLGVFPFLSSAAKDMLIYVAARVQYNSDVIELEEEKYCRVMDVARSTFFAAKKELTNRLIIPRTSRKNTYWINPSYLFRGNRMERFPTAIHMENDHPFERFKKKSKTEE